MTLAPPVDGDLWDAVVPMRTQPLHLAHINLVANLLEHFAVIRVVIGNQPRSIDDPYPFEQRLRWWQRAVEVHALDGVEFVRGAHGCTDDERVRRYIDGLSVGRIVVVSGNPEVAQFWKRRSFDVLDSCALSLRNIVGGDARLCGGDGIGRGLRAALRNGDGERDVRPLVPPWVWDDLLAS